MIVVSDTTAISTLLKTGDERLLRDQCGDILVPQAVWDDLLAFHSRLPNFVLLQPVTDPSQRLPGTESLGRAEAEAIKLATQLKADVLLVDDRKASLAAQGLGIKCASPLAVIVQGKRDGRVASVGHAIESLESRGGLYLSAKVKAAALHLAGEE